MLQSRNLLGLIPVLAVVVAQDDTAPGGTTKVGGHLGYIPNEAAAIIFFLIYFLTALHVAWLLFRHKGRYMATLVAAGFCYSAGLILRIPYRSNYDKIGFYIIMSMFTVLSPCGFIATVYVLLGRLARHLHAEEFLMIKPRILTPLFVEHATVTLLIQATGGALAGSSDVDKAKLSSHIFLAGLVLQLVSFSIFICIFLFFLYRLKSNRRAQWNLPHEEPTRRHWKGVVLAMGISCLGIIIRCAYRTIEGGQGFEGYLLTHEIFFYVLDCLPLWFAVLVYNYIWPPSILIESKGVDGVQGIELVQNDSRQKV
ncbi:RTA1-like protein [Ceratobasidium sp. AG-Ba]|nr:RTA1-like protein [Ceratobasidium sp. AG-Ba]